MSKEVIVNNYPTCDFCNKEAHYDGRTTMGGWAYMCPGHFKLLGKGLGTGNGQKLVVKGAEKS